MSNRDYHNKVFSTKPPAENVTGLVDAGLHLSTLKGFMQTDTGMQAVYQAMDQIKLQRAALNKIVDMLSKADEAGMTLDNWNIVCQAICDAEDGLGL